MGVRSSNLCESIYERECAYLTIVQKIVNDLTSYSHYYYIHILLHRRCSGTISAS